MESYFDLVMCTTLNMYALCQSKDWADFMGFFTGAANIQNNVISSVCMILVVIFPFYSYRIIKQNFGKLQMKQTKERYEIFYEGIRTNSLIRAQYNTLFMVRRAITVLILVFLDHPYFQVSFLMVFSVVNFIYQYKQRPQATKMAYFVECVNEFTIMQFSYLINVILNSATPIGFKYKIGWVLIIISTFNVLVNVVLLLGQQSFDSITNYHQTKQIKAYKAKIQKKIDSRKAICENCDYEHFKEVISAFEAIRYCRSWYPER